MFHTAAVYQDAVFGFGGGGKAGFLHCTNFADGRLLWKEESKDWTKDQNMVIADGLIFALTKNEELVMGEASRQRYRELRARASGHQVGQTAATDPRQRQAVYPRGSVGCLLPAYRGTAGKIAGSSPNTSLKRGGGVPERVPKWRFSARVDI